jgi:hypothetical protein
MSRRTSTPASMGSTGGSLDGPGSCRETSPPDRLPGDAASRRGRSWAPPSMLPPEALGSPEPLEVPLPSVAYVVCTAGAIAVLVRFTPASHDPKAALSTVLVLSSAADGPRLGARALASGSTVAMVAVGVHCTAFGQSPSLSVYWILRYPGPPAPGPLQWSSFGLKEKDED